MDTNDDYFSPGDEELQVWVVADLPNRPSGYIKGEFSPARGPHLVGVVDDEIMRRGYVTEDFVARMAESSLDSYIFFYLRVITTTNMVSEPNWRALTSVVGSDLPTE